MPLIFHAFHFGKELVTIDPTGSSLFLSCSLIAEFSSVHFSSIWSGPVPVRYEFFPVRSWSGPSGLR